MFPIVNVQEMNTIAKDMSYNVRESIQTQLSLFPVFILRRLEGCRDGFARVYIMEGVWDRATLYTELIEDGGKAVMSHDNYTVHFTYGLTKQEFHRRIINSGGPCY